MTNTVCKEHESDIERAANNFMKLSGYTNPSEYASFVAGAGWAKMDNDIGILGAGILGAVNKHGNFTVQDGKPIDFKIEENLKVIEDKEWEDIVTEFTKTIDFRLYKDSRMFESFCEWLFKNYLPPIKKEHGNKKS